MLEDIQKTINALNSADEWLTEKGLTDYVFEIITFNQTWGSTTCGFGGPGGQTLTGAPTIVVSLYDDRHEVFINGCFAYEVKNPSDIFYRDLSRRYMLGPHDCGRHLYEKKEKQGEIEKKKENGK